MGGMVWGLICAAESRDRSREFVAYELSRGSLLSGLPLSKLAPLRRDFSAQSEVETALWLDPTPSAFQLISNER